MQFNFTGASSTGKTTTLNMLHTHLPDYEIKTNIIRDLVSKENISLNEAGTRRGQELIFTAYFDSLILNKDKNYISDRCIIDPLCYTLVKCNEGDIAWEVYDAQLDITKALVSAGYLSKVFYFPISFPVVDDGVRSTDEVYRQKTDYNFHFILDKLRYTYPNKFNYYSIVGTPEERVEQILEISKYNK